MTIRSFLARAALLAVLPLAACLDEPDDPRPPPRDEPDAVRFDPGPKPRPSGGYGSGSGAPRSGSYGSGAGAPRPGAPADAGPDAAPDAAGLSDGGG